MENVVLSFSLLHLPLTAGQCVSRNMDCLSQLAFSILSKKTASLIKSLKVKLLSARLYIGNPIELEIQTPKSDMSMFFEYGEGELEPVEQCPESLTIEYYSRTQQSDNGGNTEESIWVTKYTLREWILHIQNIYNGSQIHTLKFHGSTVFDLPSIKIGLRDIEILVISIEQTGNDELFKAVTEQFLSAKRLEIAHVPEDNEHLQRVSLSNFDYLCVDFMRFPYFESLDRLLTINASTIYISLSYMPDKTINKLMKLWIKGALPRLGYLWMYLNSSTMVVKKDAILSGIRYTERRQDEERSGTFQWETGPMRFTVKGGFDIMRRDGVKATIRLKEYEDKVERFEVFVWNK